MDGARGLRRLADARRPQHHQREPGDQRAGRNNRQHGRPPADEGVRRAQLSTRRTTTTTTTRAVDAEPPDVERLDAQRELHGLDERRRVARADSLQPAAGSGSHADIVVAASPRGVVGVPSCRTSDRTRLINGVLRRLAGDRRVPVPERRMAVDQLRHRPIARRPWRRSRRQDRGRAARSRRVRHAARRRASSGSTRPRSDRPISARGATPTR